MGLHNDWVRTMSSLCAGGVCVCVGGVRDRNERSNQKVEMSVWLVDSARDYLFQVI